MTNMESKTQKVKLNQAKMGIVMHICLLKETSCYWRRRYLSSKKSRWNNCISKVDNTQIDNVKDLNVVVLMYNLVEYSDNYSKASGTLWKYCKVEPTNVLTNF